MIDSGFMIKFNDGKFHVRCEDYSKTLHIPLIRQRQIKSWTSRKGKKMTVYSFEIGTRKKYDIFKLEYQDKWHKIHHKTAKRLWEALYNDDWRE